MGYIKLPNMVAQFPCNISHTSARDDFSCHACSQTAAEHVILVDKIPYQIWSDPLVLE